MRRGHLITLYGALFAVACSVGVVLSLLARLQDEHGLPTWGLGLIASVSFFAGVVSQLWLARYADRGHGKAMMIGALVTAAAGSLIFAAGDNVGEFVAARVLLGFGFGAYRPVLAAAITVTDTDKAGQSLGMLNSVELGGFITGPAIGALLADWRDLDLPFYVFAVAILSAIPFVAGVRLPDLRGLEDDRVAVRPLLERQSVRLIAFLALVIFLPAGVFEAVWARLLEDRGASTTFVGISLFFYGIPFIVMAPIGGRLADRHGAFRVAFGGVIGIVPLLLLYGWLRSPWLIVSAAMFEGVLNGAAVPAAAAAMARATRPGELATGQGIAASGGQIAAGLAALAAAPVYAGAGPETLFTAAAVVVAVLAVTIRVRAAGMLGPAGRLVEPSPAVPVRGGRADPDGAAPTGSATRPA